MKEGSANFIFEHSYYVNTIWNIIMNNYEDALTKHNVGECSGLAWASSIINNYKWADLFEQKERRFHCFERIFEVQKYDSNDKEYSNCLEGTRTYLKKPIPRKMLYLNPLTHK